MISDADLAFVQKTPTAAMITVAADGVAKAVRVGLAVVDGKLWSSGTRERVRTERVRVDPRCTLYVHDAAWGFLTLETTVRLLEGPDAPALHVRLFREMQATSDGPLTWFGETLEEEAFLARMVAEERLIYEFEVHRSYGMH